MADRVFKNFADFKKAFRRDMRAREQRIKKAVQKTAREGAAHVRRNVPVAFSQLRDSVRASGAKIIADAPHAAAVEVGARPHFPPVDAIEKWVKLRGMQALANDRQLKRLPGTTTVAQAVAVNAALSEHAVSRSRSGAATALAVDAPRRVAFMIARAIAKKGTKPHWYMRLAVPVVRDILAKHVEAAMPDRASKG